MSLGVIIEVVVIAYVPNLTERNCAFYGVIGIEGRVPLVIALLSSNLNLSAVCLCAVIVHDEANSSVNALITDVFGVAVSIRSSATAGYGIISNFAKVRLINKAKNGITS